MEQDSHASGADTIEKDWRTLLRISSIAALLMVILIPIQVIIFSVSLPPETIEGWFELFRKSWLLGLIHLDLIYIIDNVLVAIIYLALYVILKKRNESLMAIAMLLGFLGIAAYFASNTSFEMLSLSRAFEKASSDVDRSMLMSSAQVMIETWRGTAFNTYYVLNGITLLLISKVMYGSGIFSNRTAVIGLISGILMVVPSTAGIIGLIFSLLSLIPWLIFSVMIAIRLRKLSRL
jgi:hypothetical protein